MAFSYTNIFLFFFLHQLIIFSNGQNITIKGGYWLWDSGLIALNKIDLTPFSHLFCGFADINSQSNQLILTSPNSFIQFTSIVQQKNPSAKFLLSIGGGGANKTTYGIMATTPNSRKSFIDSSIKLARQLGFHGLDLSWIFPESASDMMNLGILLNEWRIAINTEARNSSKVDLLFTAAVSGSPRVNGSIYPVQSLAKNLDWINLIAYDFYGPNWSPSQTNSHAQLFDPVNYVSGSDGIDQWIQQGVPPQKIVFGIPFYGYAWRLNNTNIHGLRAPAIGKSDVYDDPWMTYAQIRDFIVQHRATTIHDDRIIVTRKILGLVTMIFKLLGLKCLILKAEGCLVIMQWIFQETLIGILFFLMLLHKTYKADGVTQGEIVKKKKKLNRLVIILIPIGALLILILLMFIIWYLRRRQVPKFQELERNKMGSNNKARKSGDNSNLQVFSFDEMKEATNNFSFDNKLGEGGYGPVFEGMLRNGEKIAVKRLSETSSQGLEEFENEVILTAKLQHINLVKVVGFCIENQEKMLIYEYMPNKSLDHYIYNQVRRLVLNWEKRVQIIEGIIQGLLYLQEYSRLTIIHRDIKASNILLDLQMKPKISDFGMARMFKEDEVEANTSRIVGTLGYAPPEYIKQGIYSTKSDVFSFGVLLLQIISGKKNTCFYGPDEQLNLLEYAFEMWRDGKGMEFMDESLDDKTSYCKLLNCMQIALLCVQKNPLDRPTMLEVSNMLKNIANLVIEFPKRPAFSVKEDEESLKKYGLVQEREEVDTATITQLIAR
ncbi:hypothetical protein MTR67_029699 [Solanum verrucosum]|uniref:non-specific serine/threonine protein kinase n=1 Tax=Solanum verrucosum TaxID=315347 RepID=A0AAF0R4S1_SOLVR|nr:hypothetical protein MTR67_029699 [Solanum verrucosum]